jgi:GMP synthase-like glutamine amidotransferase
MHFHCLLHAPFEPPGTIENWILEHKHHISTTKLWLGDAPPCVDEFDALVIMGGPMSIHDESKLEWLKSEKRLIGETIRKEKKILAVCLGAQLVAEALGATVRENTYPEIGFFPVEFSKKAPLSFLPLLPEKITTFHWHSETFDTPVSAICLASSGACKNQAYAVADRILAIQFHPEVTAQMVEDMVFYGKAELERGPWIQSAEEMFSKLGCLEDNKRLLFALLDAFFSIL